MRFSTLPLLLFGCLYFSSSSLVAQEAARPGDINAFFDDNHRPFLRGHWLGSLTFDLESNNTTDQSNLFQDIIRRERNSYGVGAAVGYFVKDYMALGARYDYERAENDVDFLDSDGKEINRRTASASNRGAVFLRNYIPISANERFNLFNETNLSVGYRSEAIRRTASPDDITKQFNEEMVYRFGLRPGVNVFIVKGFSFELSLNVIGLTVKQTETREDDGPVGKSTDVDLDLQVSLLSLDFGLSYYF